MIGAFSSPRAVEDLRPEKRLRILPLLRGQRLEQVALALVEGEVVRDLSPCFGRVRVGQEELRRRVEVDRPGDGRLDVVRVLLGHRPDRGPVLARGRVELVDQRRHPGLAEELRDLVEDHVLRPLPRERQVPDELADEERQRLANVRLERLDPEEVEDGEVGARRHRRPPSE